MGGTQGDRRGKREAFLWGLAAVVAVALAVLVVPARGDVQVEADVVYGEAGGQKLLLDIYRPPAPAARARPALLLVHGGGWRGGNKKDLRDAGMGFARQGYVCFSVSYRLVTDRGNRYPAQLDDVQRAVRWVRANAGKYGVDPERVGALGASAGGHLVALLGTCDTRDNTDPELARYSSRVRCVVDLFGPTDLTVPFPGKAGGFAVQRLVEDLIGKPPAEATALTREASPLFHINKKTVPFLILHGTADPIVPVDQSERFHLALQKAGIESTFLKFEGEGHGFQQKQNTEEFIRETVKFLARHLKP